MQTHNNEKGDEQRKKWIGKSSVKLLKFEGRGRRGVEGEVGGQEGVGVWGEGLGGGWGRYGAISSDLGPPRAKRNKALRYLFLTILEVMPSPSHRSSLVRISSKSPSTCELLKAST